MSDIKKTTTRICKFCNAEFVIRNYLPYYSCSECRKKELYERSLTVKTCSICGDTISAPRYTTICKSCAALLKHKKVKKPQVACNKCSKLFYSVSGEKLCLHCRKDAADKTTHCIFCGSYLSSKKSKVCDKCKEEGYDYPKKICINCNKVFAASDDNTNDWTKIAFCSRDCCATWHRNHLAFREKRYSSKDIKNKAKQVLSENSNATSHDIIKSIGINAGTLSKKGIRISDIRKELLLPNLKYKSSIFENTIYDILQSLNFTVEREKTYKDLIYTRNLRYDFYIPELNLLIEADGQQHYEEVDPYGCKSLILVRDALKNEYARTNNINLLRIRYFRPHNKLRIKELSTLLQKLQCTFLETGELKLFNCWDGGEELLPISSEACSTEQERSTTIPQGSTD